MTEEGRFFYETGSLNVKPGDIIEIQFGNRNTKVEVLSINETYKKDEAKELYRYV